MPNNKSQISQDSRAETREAISVGQNKECYNRIRSFPAQLRKSLLYKEKRWCAVEVSNL
jgi:hypothetical protein